MIRAIFVSVLIGLSSFSVIAQDDYKILWSKVEDARAARLPQTALQLVDSIYEQADKDKVQDQLLKAIIYKAGLTEDFKDQDYATLITDLEECLMNLDSQSSKALLHSILGEIYHSYGMANSFRFSNRNTNSQGDFTALMSLEEIQTKAIAHFEASLSIDLDVKLDELTALTKTFDQAQEGIISLEATDLRSFLLFRAIRHFQNSSAFVSKAQILKAFDDPRWLDPGDVFKNLEIIPGYDYRMRCLKLYQDAESAEYLNNESRQKLYLARLDFVRSVFDGQKGDSLYLSALQNLCRNWNEEGLVYCKLIKYYLDKASQIYVPGDSSSSNHYKNAFKYINKFQKEYPESVISEIVNGLRAKLNESSLSVTLEEVIPKARDFMMHAHYRNLDEIKVRIYKLTESEYLQFVKSPNTEQKMSFLGQKAPYIIKEFKLPAAQDFNFHAIELPFEGLDYGRYILLAGTGEEGNVSSSGHLQVCSIVVSDMSYYTYFENKQYKGRLVDRTSGLGIGDAKIIIEPRISYNASGHMQSGRESLQSDKEGFFTLPKSDRPFEILAVKNSDSLWFNKSHYNYRNETDSEKHSLVSFYTDRSIYRPGQTIYFKALYMQKSNADFIPQLLKNRYITISLRDVHGRIVDELKLRSDDYGAFEGSFIIPDPTLTGQFSLQAAGMGYQTFYVEEYKRPKIKAVFDSLTATYMLGDTIHLSGLVESYSGILVDNAQIRYTIERSPYHSFRWDRIGRDNPSELVTQGFVSSDNNGAFSFDFNSGNATDGIIQYIYTVRCDIIDKSGETIVLEKQINLSESAFIVDLSVPETVMKEDKWLVEIAATNSEAVAQNINVIAKVYQLYTPIKFTRDKYWQDSDQMLLSEKEYNGRFPYDYYLTRDKDLDILDTIAIYEFEGSRITTDVFSDLSSGSYRLDFVVRDMNNNTMSISRTIDVSERDRRMNPSKAIWHSRINPAYSPGDVFKMYVDTPFKRHEVHYAITSHNKIVEQGILDKSQKEIRFRLAEKHRGGLGLKLFMIKHGRHYSEELTIAVPWDNKQINVEIENFRDFSRPGETSNLSIRLKDIEGNPVKAQVLASMYDASLDAIRPHKWLQAFYPNKASPLYMRSYGLGTARRFYYSYRQALSMPRLDILFTPRLNYFGFENVFFSHPHAGANEDLVMRMNTAKGPAPELSTVYNYDQKPKEEIESLNEAARPDVIPRKDFNETAFFYPMLESSDQGFLEMSYTLTDALTNWKLQVFVHDDNLRYGYTEAITISQKQLMLESFLPRILRAGDSIVVTASLSNNSDRVMKSVSWIELKDALTGESLDNWIIRDNGTDSIQLMAGERKILSWTLKVPVNFANPVEIIMKAGNDAYTDGESHIIPVLPSREYVIESLPLFVGPDSEEFYSFEALEKMTQSNSLESLRLDLRYTADASQLILQALPSLYSPDDYKSTEIAEAIYAYLLGVELLKKYPYLEENIKSWQLNDPESPLFSNPDLKDIDLELTPWLNDALGEQKNIQSLMLLSDPNRVTYLIRTYAQKLALLQKPDGGFPWCKSGPSNLYIGMYILELAVRLDKIGLDYSDALSRSMISALLRYTDEKILKLYASHNSADHILPELLVQYLYVRTYFEDPKSDDLDKLMKEWRSTLAKSWVKYDTYMQAMIAFIMLDSGALETVQNIKASLDERIIRDDNLGYYWNDLAGYYWYEQNIEKQALLIDLYSSTASDSLLVDGMRQWLLTNKQLNAWPTGRATASAVFSFFSDSESRGLEGTLSFNFQDSGEELTYLISNQSMPVIQETWKDTSVISLNKDFIISNNSSRAGWGSVNWHYFEDIDKIQATSPEAMSIHKTLWHISSTEQGITTGPVDEKTILKPGTTLRSRIEISSDRPMEFIVLEDLRGSGLEAVDIISSYKYQDGLSYYSTTGDQGSKFYIEYLPKGHFVFEYDVIVKHAGKYSTGLATLQSYYAPEFSSHSSGAMITVDELD